MHLVAMETAERRVAQRSATTPGQTDILAKPASPSPAATSTSSFRRLPRSPRSQARVVTRLKRSSPPVLPTHRYFPGLSCAHHLRKPGHPFRVDLNTEEP